MDPSCCTCASLLASVPPAPPGSEKPYPEARELPCCGRIVCGRCIHSNARFAAYCPYCQVSSTPSALPQGLRELPAYTSLPNSGTKSDGVSSAPPPYAPPGYPRPTSPPSGEYDEKAAPPPGTSPPPPSAEDTLHFLDHEHDTISSLSLRYGVPAAALRRANNLASDHLLPARRTILIPGEFYRAGVSLSPRPVGGEDEERRKAQIRRFMTGCKVADYDVALLYLEHADYDLSAAVDAFFEDEAWERAHPLEAAKGKARARREPRNRGPFWRGLPWPGTWPGSGSGPASSG